MRLTYSGEPQIFTELGPDVVQAGDVIEIPDERAEAFVHRPDFSEATDAGTPTAKEIAASIGADTSDEDLAKLAADDRVTISRPAQAELERRAALATTDPEAPAPEGEQEEPATPAGDTTSDDEPAA